MVGKQHPRQWGSVQQQFSGVRGIIGSNVLVLGQGEGSSTLPRATDHYCAVIEVKPVNYLLMAPEEQEAIITGFRSLINTLSFPVQILTRVTPLDLVPFLAHLRSRAEAFHQHPAHPNAGLLANLTTDAVAFVQLLATRRRLLERHCYLIIPAATSNEQSMGQLVMARLHLILRRHPTRAQVFADLRQQSMARSQLDMRVAQVLKLLASVGLDARRVERLALAHLYYSCLSPQQAHTSPLTPEALASIQRPTEARAPRSWAAHRQRPSRQSAGKPVVEPSRPARAGKVATPHPPESGAAPFVTLSDLIAPACVELTPQAVQLDDEYARTLVVVAYPRHVYPGWLPHLMSVDVPHDLALHIVPLDAGGMIRRLTRQMAEYRASELLDARQGRMPDAERTVAYQDVERLRDRLQRGEERIFALSLYLTIRAPSLRVLDDYTAQMRTVLDNLLLVARPAVYEHDLGLRSCLPEARDHLKRHRLLDSSSVATAFPFASATLAMPQGILYGVASDGGLIILDPFASEFENANQVVFAKSGAGKSYACKLQALRLLMLGYSVVAPGWEIGNEYDRSVQDQGNIPAGDARKTGRA